MKETNKQTQFPGFIFFCNLQFQQSEFVTAMKQLEGSRAGASEYRCGLTTIFDQSVEQRRSGSEYLFVLHIIVNDLQNDCERKHLEF